MCISNSKCTKNFRNSETDSTGRMTRYCVVPSCNTGRKRTKEHCSVFKTPKNLELREKWATLIPGIKKLKLNHYVCAKHFDERCVITKLVMRDAHGNVVAEAPYLRARLSESAIPTIFNNESSTPESHCKIEDSDETVASDQNATSDPTAEETAAVDPAGESSHVPIPSPLAVDAPSEPDDTAELPFKPEETDVKAPLNEECAITRQASQHFTGFTTVYLEEAPTSKETDESTETPIDSVNTRIMKASTALLYEESSIKIPKSWGFTETHRGTKRCLVFSHLLFMTNNEEDGPIVEKCVVIESDGRINYRVHGKLVDINEIDMLNDLKDLSSISDVLLKFQRKRVCQGIGSVEQFLIQEETAYRNVRNDWHHVDCKLLSTKKRCETCQRLRHTLLQRKARFDKHERIQRVTCLSNPIDQKKMMALRQRLNRTRRMKNRAKSRIEALQNELKLKENELAGMKNEIPEKNRLPSNMSNNFRDPVMLALTVVQH